MNMSIQDSSGFQKQRNDNTSSLPSFIKQPVNSQARPPLRIADILVLDDDDHVLLIMEEDDEVSTEWRRSSNCFSSRQILARWLSSLKRTSLKRVKESSSGKKDVVGSSSGGSDRTVQVKCSVNGFNGQDLANSVSDNTNTNSGQGRKETSFNLGVGCCLLYLIAASKNELGKVMEMRTQMEALLRNAREELKKKDADCKPSESEQHDIFSHFISINDAECPNFEDQHSPEILTPSYVLPASSTVTVCDQSLRYETPKRGERLEGMDQLEAELQVELERLQHHLDTEKLPKRPQQRGLWVDSVVSDTSRSKSLSSGEVIDDLVIVLEEASSEVQYGVPPHELERRLHELLESRQQEQIRELEATLECLKHKLREKEMEVTWWKDTARLISHHLPESSRFSSQHRAKLLSP